VNRVPCEQRLDDVMKSWSIARAGSSGHPVFDPLAAVFSEFSAPDETP